MEGRVMRAQGEVGVPDLDPRLSATENVNGGELLGPEGGSDGCGMYVVFMSGLHFCGPWGAPQVWYHNTT